MTFTRGFAVVLGLFAGVLLQLLHAFVDSEKRRLVRVVAEEGHRPFVNVAAAANSQ